MCRKAWGFESLHPHSTMETDLRRKALGFTADRRIIHHLREIDRIDHSHGDATESHAHDVAIKAIREEFRDDNDYQAEIIEE